MSLKREAGSQAGWALISGGVGDARVEVHRIRQLLHKVLKLVDSSEHKEHLYQVAGDMVMAIPARVEALEKKLDGLGYALSIMGKNHLQERLPLSDRMMIETTVEGSPAFKAPTIHQSARRVAEQHLTRRVARKYLERDR